MIIFNGQCERCRHYRGLWECAAFPDGIPSEITTATLDRPVVDHRQPFPGDNGIRFEPLPGKRHPLDVIQEQR